MKKNQIERRSDRVFPKPYTCKVYIFKNILEYQKFYKNKINLRSIISADTFTIFKN